MQKGTTVYYLHIFFFLLTTTIFRKIATIVHYKVKNISKLFKKSIKKC